jgi:hypothetical protein
MVPSLTKLLSRASSILLSLHPMRSIRMVVALLHPRD